MTATRTIAVMAMLLAATTIHAKPKHKYIRIDGERWEIILTESVLNLEKGKVETFNVERFGMVYPKKDRCPAGWTFSSFASTTFAYRECHKEDHPGIYSPNMWGTP